MDQHEFVAKCYANYAELGLEPGNPDDGEWQKAHYPAPKGEGESVIWLMPNDHQIQGLLQSEEYGRMCFYPYDVKKFLTRGCFVPCWFELWGIYQKWASEHSKINSSTMNAKVHSKKNGNGKSQHAIECGKRNGVKCAMSTNASKDEFGRSKNAVKGSTMAHMLKNGEGKSILGVENARRMHSKKNELGKSVVGVKNAKTLNSQKWKCLVTGKITNAGALTGWQRARGIDISNRTKVE